MSAGSVARRDPKREGFGWNVVEQGQERKSVCLHQLAVPIRVESRFVPAEPVLLCERRMTLTDVVPLDLCADDVLTYIRFVEHYGREICNREYFIFFLYSLSPPDCLLFLVFFSPYAVLGNH